MPFRTERVGGFSLTPSARRLSFSVRVCVFLRGSTALEYANRTDNNTARYRRRHTLVTMADFPHLGQRLVLGCGTRVFHPFLWFWDFAVAHQWLGVR